MPKVNLSVHLFTLSGGEKEETYKRDYILTFGSCTIKNYVFVFYDNWIDFVERCYIIRHKHANLLRNQYIRIVFLVQ